jgi:hypothetical protein
MPSQSHQQISVFIYEPRKVLLTMDITCLTSCRQIHLETSGRQSRGFQASLVAFSRFTRRNSIGGGEKKTFLADDERNFALRPGWRDIKDARCATLFLLNIFIVQFIFASLRIRMRFSQIKTFYLAKKNFFLVFAGSWRWHSRPPSLFFVHFASTKGGELTIKAAAHSDSDTFLSELLI